MRNGDTKQTLECSSCRVETIDVCDIDISASDDADVLKYVVIIIYDRKIKFSRLCYAL